MMQRVISLSYPFIASHTAPEMVKSPNLPRLRKVKKKLRSMDKLAALYEPVEMVGRHESDKVRMTVFTSKGIARLIRSRFVGILGIYITLNLGVSDVWEF